MGVMPFFGRDRLGQAEADPAAQTRAQDWIAARETLHVIDVTGAEEADTGNGHWYFQSSPWASSDLFLSLLTDKGPAERGLARRPGEAVWRFPASYEARLAQGVAGE